MSPRPVQEAAQPADKNKLPPWMKQESKPYLSKEEQRLYKLFTFLPVLVTFTIYTILLVYYVFVSKFVESIQRSTLTNSSII